MVSAGTVPAGVGDAYIAKPFEPAELVETVRRLVRRRLLADHSSCERGTCAHAPDGADGSDEPPSDPHRGRTAATSGP
jgi:DNA-binding response OmpR family regulator